MITTTKTMVRRAAPTTSTTFYTVPTGKSAVITNIVISNSAATGSTITLNIAGIALTSGVVINPNDTVAFDLKQTMSAGEVISGFASSTSVNIHISGVEIS